MASIRFTFFFYCHHPVQYFLQEQKVFLVIFTKTILTFSKYIEVHNEDIRMEKESQHDNHYKEPTALGFFVYSSLSQFKSYLNCLFYDIKVHK